MSLRGRDRCISQENGAGNALSLAWDIQVEAAKVGFDWPDVGGVFAKLREEVAEIESALAEQQPEKARAELGDLLFSAVNLARFLEADPAAELRRTNEKFLRRFAEVTKRVNRTGRRTGECTLEELDVFWDQVKREEHSAQDGA